ncbi:MAG: phenylalanine--tRNA ligase subunit beta [Candidatus Melainabacteria bacterium]|nr:phenylalanine--tRNA ligase subunit beta [Candidatus Melainabacteria bacterium]
MKLSYSWLCDYVDLTGFTPQEVADKLTMGAFEVEEISTSGPNITGPVVSGEILDIKVHPNADKIRLTKVRLADGADPVEIVCGAQNIEVGQRIPVALPGAVVLNRKTGDKLEIKASEIRGVHSNGMLCSPPELGITDGDSEGIYILSKPGEKGFPLGVDMIEHMSLKPEYIFHVGSRSNRGDAMSVVGLAREVAALMGRQLKLPDWDLKNAGADNQAQASGFTTKIESTEDCPYFSIRLIENVKIGPSPAWLARRLESLGLRSVNNVVDITNYVMLELGQPLHAYDLAKVKAQTLAVRRAQSGEKLTSIDGKVRDLNDEILAITDGEDVVGLAGIMGGKDSEISETTTSIALEAAAFAPARVRRGSRLTGLSSDSSLRFERGVDVESVKNASDRATYLISKYCGDTTVVKSFFESGSPKTEPTKVSMRMSRVKQLLDVEISAEDSVKFLASLGFTADPQDVKPDQITVSVPSFRRQDVTREIDLIEEVCRLFGYDNLPEAMPRSSTSPQRQDRLINDLRNGLSAQGLSEAWLGSLTGDEDLSSAINSSNGAEHSKDNGSGAQKSESTAANASQIRVLNPLSKDHQVLRQSLIPGLVDAVKYNHDRGIKDVWLFETGRSYEKAADKARDKWNTGVQEKHLVGGIIAGTLANQVTKSEKQKDKVVSKPTLQETVDFFRMKGVVENVLQAAGIPTKRLRFYKTASNPSFMHPYRVCQIAVAPADKFPRDIEGKLEDKVVRLGFIGELNPKYLAEHDMREAAFVFELDIEQISKNRVEKTFKEPAQTPSVTRDLTIDLQEEVPQSAVVSVIEASGGAALTEVELVSTYQLEEGVQSLSYRLTFQDREKTLTADELDKSLAKVRDSLASRVKAKFRA